MKPYSLDTEELEILDAIEKGEWKLARPNKSELARYMQIAKNTLRKDQRMNIRISKADLNRIKVKAVERGIPYQTLVASILHQYVSGTLIAA
ncbi:MAG: antitoxin [Chlamydiae bacterium]|nr:antitoxin [Chlamydiota bacterium]MBI3276580.1 antitoxin [Chlamydiota bacterium]